MVRIDGEAAPDVRRVLDLDVLFTELGQMVETGGDGRHVGAHTGRYGLLKPLPVTSLPCSPITGHKDPRGVPRWTDTQAGILLQLL